MNTIQFRTETGSLYEIDYDKKQWSRLEEPKIQGRKPLRTKTGPFNEISDIVIGQFVLILGPSLTPGKERRCIRTSYVVEILTQ
jgi:hypothetical protein